jgi:hypothetical protein
MSRRWLLLIGVLLVAALGGASGSSAFSSPPAATVTPHRFASCPALVGYAQANLSRTHGLPEPPIEAVAVATATTGAKGVAPSAAAASGASAAADGGASPAYSTTNNQEEGVDEPDLVKTNGSTIFTIAGNKLEAVDVSGATPKLAGTLDLGPNGYNAQLLLRGNRLIVISTQVPVVPLPAAGGVAAAPASLRASPYFLYGSTTQLSEVDISNPASLKITQTLNVDGRFVDARQAGSSARIVISSAPHAIIEPALAGATSGWVPSWTFKDRRTGRRFVRPVAACSSIRRPVQFSGLGMLSIVTVDFDKGLGAAHTDALMADAQIVYGSQTSLYLATQKWIDPTLPVPQLPSGQTTVIDRFDVTDPDTTSFVASGEVPGYLLNQFSLSEQDGYLRVASTSRPIWWGLGGDIKPGVGSAVPVSQSYVTVLQMSGNVLAPVGQVSGLGQGEQITSVRFIGDTGYVVTYRQVDPLYTVDLSTPTAPKVAGQLDLAGYSAYLHPVGPGLLLGVGTDVSSDNEPDGSQLELFDVSNPASPKLLAKTLIGTGSSTQVTSDHHAFLFWQPTDLAVLPVQVYGAGGGPIVCVRAPCNPGTPTPADQFTGAIGYKIDGSGISEVGRVVQDAVNGAPAPIERSVVVGGSLYTISNAGVLASNLGTLARQAFVAFPTS